MPVPNEGLLLVLIKQQRKYGVAKEQGICLQKLLRVLKEKALTGSEQLSESHVINLTTHTASNIYYIFILFKLPSTGCLVSASDYDSICICTYIVSEARKSGNDVSYALS